ncbi:unnamed protein product, partial [Amoebophrya sp. A120]
GNNSLFTDHVVQLHQLVPPKSWWNLPARDQNLDNPQIFGAWLFRPQQHAIIRQGELFWLNAMENPYEDRNADQVTNAHLSVGLVYGILAENTLGIAKLDENISRRGETGSGEGKFDFYTNLLQQIPLESTTKVRLLPDPFMTTGPLFSGTSSGRTSVAGGTMQQNSGSLFTVKDTVTTASKTAANKAPTSTGSSVTNLPRNKQVDPPHKLQILEIHFYHYPDIHMPFEKRPGDTSDP